MFSLLQTTHRRVLRHHPEVGHLFVPGIRARIPSETGAFYVVTNAQGFRSDVPFVAPRGDRPRILFFGDSFTAGDGVDNAQRYPELVGQALGAEVYNYAVSGAGTDQQLLVYERLARAVPADLVVIGVHVENVERNRAAFHESVDRLSRRRLLVPKPYFELLDGRLALRHIPVPLQRPAADELGQAGAGVASDPLQRLVYQPLARFKKDPRLQAARAAVKEHLPWLMPAMLKRSGFQPHPDYASADTEGWRLMQAILARFIEAAAPTPVLVVPIPDRYFYHDGLEPLYQPLFERLGAPARGVHVMDLTRPLHALPRLDRPRLAFERDSHFSPFGHAQVARIVAEAIQARGLLSLAPADTPAPSLPAPMTLKSTVAVPGYDGGHPQTPGAAFRGRNTGAPAAPGPTGAGPRRGTYILGISGFSHDSAAALICDGEIVAAAAEARFSRVENDRRFPARAANYCLEEAGIGQNDLAAVVHDDNAPLAFERLLHTIAAVGSEGRDTWARSLPTWLRHELHVPQRIRRHLAYDGLVLQASHQRSHAASAFYPSPFDRAAIVTLDGVGGWATGSIGAGDGRAIKLLQEMRFPGSIGLLYAAFTRFAGFTAGAGERALMGLAPHGEPRYVGAIFDHLVDLKEDGSVELELDAFAFLSQPATTSDKLAALFGGPARAPGARLTQREMDLARSIQFVTEEALLRTARHAHRLTGEKRLCLGGGVALNGAANGRLLREGPFDDIWIQPAAGDAGGALGAALDAYHTYFEKLRTIPTDGRSLQGGSYLGPAYSTDEIRAFVETHGYPHTHLDPARRALEIAGLVAAGKVVGHFAGRLEFGPCSLGARAILGDARNPEMQATLDLAIDHGESFRPFALSVLAERARDYFDLGRESPYLLLVAPVKASHRLPFTREGTDLTALIRKPRSDVPAVTHVDYSARVHTVARRDHPAYHDVIKAFDRLTGCAVVVNTSFNVRGEPLVCTPDDAYRCFMRTGMDYLVLGDFLLAKGDQPPWSEPKGHAAEPGDTDTGADRAFADRISSAFLSDFLPAVSGLPRDALLVRAERRKLPTTWIDVRDPPDGKSLFVIPPVLDSSTTDPSRMAAAITASWAPGPATEALRRVLTRLLAISIELPPPDQP